MKWKNIISTILISAATALGSVFLYTKYIAPQEQTFQIQNDKLPVNYASYKEKAVPTNAVDFTQAASVAVPTTVHITTKINPHEVSGGHNAWDDMFGGNDLFNQFFGHGGGRYEVPGEMAAGSGVIISDDGYIVTNNHVIDGADKIVVTLNDGKSYKAKVVGTDLNTDLAVLKISADHLPYMLFSNSDDVKVGQWVLAIGYPLNLQTTVTAGIVSAKARSIGINKEGTNPIESYIQTDAAVNPGNSGGPLVNTDGELVGINSAIASPTGSYAGYAYAVPVNLIKKVVNDIIKYGTVQRAYLGIELQRSKPDRFNVSVSNSKVDNGIYVAGVMTNGGAADAGLQKGDVITSIDGTSLRTQPELLGKIANYKPGDKIKVTYLRDGKENTTTVTLKNVNGTTKEVKYSLLDKLGADFRDLPQKNASQIGIKGGVFVNRIGSGMIHDQTDMQPGFVITKVGKTTINNVQELKDALQNQQSNVQIEGIYPGHEGVYYYGLNNLNSAEQ